MPKGHGLLMPLCLEAIYSVLRLLCPETYGVLRSPCLETAIYEGALSRDHSVLRLLCLETMVY